MLQIDQLMCLASQPVASSAALRQAVHLAAARTKASAQTNTTLHVVSHESINQSSFVETVREQIAPLGEGLTLKTRALSPSGEPEAYRRSIQRCADDVDADLVAFDPPTNRGAVPPLADDWTRVLVEGVDCPLFLVEEAGPPDSTEHILVPTDLSEESIYTLRHATELAAGYDASVVLLHAIDKSPYVALTPVDRLSLGSTTLSEHRAHRRLQQFLEKGRPPDVPVQTRLAFGDPADCIAHVVTDQSVDLLVLASHGEGGHPEPSIGPVGDRLLRRVACPTLFLRAGGRSLLPARSGGNSTSESRDGA